MISRLLYAKLEMHDIIDGKGLKWFEHVDRRGEQLTTAEVSRAVDRPCLMESQKRAKRGHWN